jgi:hypothetical protein
MAPARPGILHRVLSVFRPRHPQVHESKDHETSPPPFAPPPYAAADTAPPVDEKQKHSTTQAPKPQNAPHAQPPTSSPSSQLYIRQYLSNARTTRTKLIQSFKIIKSLGHSSTTQWALNNRDSNVERMRQFLRRWLTREYFAEAHNSTPHGYYPYKDQYTSSTHGTHFICLSRLLFYLVPYQNLHGWDDKDQSLKKEIWDYVKANLRAPLLALEIDEAHVVQVLQYFFQFEQMMKGVNKRVHEQFARDGWFDVLKANIAEDMKMVGKVVPDDESNAKEILVAAIKNTQALYFASVDDGSKAFSPSYLLTNYAKRNLCPCCQEAAVPPTTSEPLKDPSKEVG